MNNKSHALGISVVAGIIAMVLVVAVLILHAFDSNTTSGELSGVTGASSAGHESPDSSTGSGAHVMPDGSLMDTGDMSGTEHTGEMSTTGHGAGSETAVPEETGHAVDQSAGGSIDWQVIGLILALVSTGIAVGGGLKEYLRRQIALGRAADPGLQHE